MEFNGIYLDIRRVIGNFEYSFKNLKIKFNI